MTRKDIVSAVRRLRNDIITRRANYGDVRESLRYQCDHIRDLELDGQDWSSKSMPDPLFQSELGHAVRIVNARGIAGWVVSLTGKIILGRINNVTSDADVQRDLERITKVGNWVKKTK